MTIRYVFYNISLISDPPLTDGFFGFNTCHECGREQLSVLLSARCRATSTRCLANATNRHFLAMATAVHLMIIRCPNTSNYATKHV